MPTDHDHDAARGPGRGGEAPSDAALCQTLASAQRAIDCVRRGLREGRVYHDRLLSIGEMDALSDLIAARLARHGAADGSRP